MGLEHGRTENCGVARCGIWLATSSGCLRGGGQPQSRVHPCVCPMRPLQAAAASVGLRGTKGTRRMPEGRHHLEEASTVAAAGGDAEKSLVCVGHVWFCSLFDKHGSSVDT